MSERTFVPIFIFWAFLTIITPTLVLLSENSKQHFDSYGNSTEVGDDRRMTDQTTPPPCSTVVATAPAEAPIIVSLPTGANLTAAVVCRHNGSIGSNKSDDDDDDDGVTQMFPRKRLKQTKLQST